MSTKRRIDHTKNISSEKPLRGFVNVIPGDLITFKYRGKDIYDRQPLIFVLFNLFIINIPVLTKVFFL